MEDKKPKKLTYNKLFTPGPIQVTDNVRLALSSHTYGSREPDFLEVVTRVRKNLLKVANVSDKYCCILMQGSGTFGNEAVIQTVIPDSAKVLLLTNGAFGYRLGHICDCYKLKSKVAEFDELKSMDHVEANKIIDDYDPTHVLLVHSETSTGTINPYDKIGQHLIERAKKNKTKKAVFIIDAMSSFGGTEIDIENNGVDFLVSSPNKCLQSCPGFAVIYAKKSSLVDHSRGLALNIKAQNDLFEKYGQFRFTPPIETILAMDAALKELLKETVLGRQARYKENTVLVRKGMKEMGFDSFLPDDVNGHLVSCYHYPKSKNWVFFDFYKALNDRGYRIYIYPGKRTKTLNFRIGTMGDIFPEDIKKLLKQIKEVKEIMKF